MYKSEQPDSIWEEGTFCADSSVRFTILPRLAGEEAEPLIQCFDAFQKSYSMALAATRCSIWEYDVKSRILCVPAGQFPVAAIQKRGVLFYNVPESLIADRIIHPEDVGDFWNAYKELHTGLDYLGCLVRVLDRHQVYRWNRLYCQIEKDESGNPARLVGIMQDIQREREIERSASTESNLRSSLLADAISVYELNLTKDEVCRISTENERVTGQTIKKVSELLRFVRENLIDFAHRAAFFETFAVETVLEEYRKGKREISLEFRRLNSAGDMQWVCMTEYLYTDAEHGDEILSFCICRDIHESKMREQELQYKAEVDSLTKVYNRAAAIARVEAHLAQNANGLHALMILDIDHFKKVNDTYGHVYGDSVLSEISQKLRRLFRSNDVIGRLGGDEFLIFLPDIAMEETAIRRAEEVCSELRATYSSGAGPCEVSVSVGIVFARHETEFYDLYQEADDALYQAKENGRDGYAIYESNHKDRAQLEMQGRFRECSKKMHRASTSKNLLKNISKILHSFFNPKQAIPPVLELLARQFGAQRAYIYERSRFNEPFRLTFEWNSIDEQLLSQDLFHIPSVIPKEEDPLFGQECLCVHDIDYAEASIQWVGEQLGLKAMIRSGFYLDESCYGFVGLDILGMSHYFTEEEQEMFCTASKVLEEYVLVNRNKQNLERQLDIMRGLMEHSPASILILDVESRRVVYYNRRAGQMFPDVVEGKLLSGDPEGSGCENGLFQRLDELREEMLEGSVSLPCPGGGCVQGNIRWVYWYDGMTCCMLEVP
ncbi:MAG: putative signaling protein [Oscillospiraceae bacterium]|nr:putative signaling protein [Oscillospiraceae bacterium]